MAISNLNPVRLVSFEFKAPAPSIARRASLPAAPATHRAATYAVDRAGPEDQADAFTVKPRPIEPMLLLHQEQAETIRLVFDAVSRAIRTLTGHATRV
jgi:hypothetical protein